MVDPSTAMFFALASSRLTAPWTLCTTERFWTSVLDRVSEVLATRVAAVLVVKAFDALTL